MGHPRIENDAPFQSYTRVAKRGTWLEEQNPH
jgi:hypothetical protein